MSRQLPPEVERNIKGQPWEHLVRECYPTPEEDARIAREREREERLRERKRYQALEALADKVLAGEYGAPAQAAAHEALEMGRNYASLTKVERIAQAARRKP